MLLELMKNNYLEYVKINLTSGTLHCYKSNLDTIFRFFKKNRIIDSDNIDNMILTKFTSNSSWWMCIMKNKFVIVTISTKKQNVNGVIRWKRHREFD